MRLTAAFCFILSVICLTNSPDNLLAGDHAPFESTGEGPLFYIDYSNFRADNNKTYIEFYIQFGYQHLQFIKSRESFKAGYDFEIKVLDENGNLIGEQQTEDVFEVNSFKETYSSKKARISLIAFTLAPGLYTFRAVAKDHETQKTALVDGYVEAKDFTANNLVLSDIQFSQNIHLAADGQPYVKNQRYIEPNAVRIFSYGIADIFIYFEVYNLNYSSQSDTSNYMAYFTILDESGKQFTQIKKRHVKPGTTSAHSFKLPIDYFLSGKYSLSVKVTDELSNETYETSKAFQVLETPVSLSTALQEDIIE